MTQLTTQSILVLMNYSWLYFQATAQLELKKPLGKEVKNIFNKSTKSSCLQALNQNNHDLDEGEPTQTLKLIICNPFCVSMNVNHRTHPSQLLSPGYKDVSDYWLAFGICILKTWPDQDPLIWDLRIKNTRLCRLNYAKINFIATRAENTDKDGQ